MKKAKFFRLFFTTFLLIFILFSPACKKREAKKEEVIKIGAILPLTGGAAEFGVGNKNGIILMVEDINAKGGVDGKKISVFFEDSQSDPKIAISIFNKMLKTDEPDFLFICLSSVAMALKPLIEQNKIPAFCVS
ncbi:MAG: ABC transporter substrate-binding protein, partial [candidate division WOR-3 bacterium]